MSDITITSLPGLGNGTPLGFMYFESPMRQSLKTAITKAETLAQNHGANAIINFKIIPVDARSTYLITGDIVRYPETVSDDCPIVSKLCNKSAPAC